MASGPGLMLPYDAFTGESATIEGIVTRNADAYTTDAFSHNVFKYVRKGHVKTDEHWTRNWRWAKLLNEGGNYVAV
jgi:hypothetical protein